MPARDFYQIVGTGLPRNVVDELNSILSRIANRLDQIEGFRGLPTVRDSLTVTNTTDANTLHGINTNDTDTL